ncbi:MAG: hypothetical protein ACOH5I_00310 [Oligoflexus sp.]
MRLRANHIILFCFTTFGALNGCSVDSVFTPDVKNSGASGSAESRRQLADKDQVEEDFADQAASEPVMTGGAFLSCELLDPQSLNASQQDFGCRLEIEGKKANINPDYQLEVNLLDENQETIPLPVLEEEFESIWHWTFSIDRQIYLSALLFINIFDPYTGLSQEYVHDLNMNDQQAVEADGELDLTALKEHSNGQGDQPRRDPRGRDKPLWRDGRKNFAETQEFTIPERILVLQGNAANRLSVIRFDNLQCTYRGGADIASPLRANDPVQIEKGLYYEFQECGSFQAGDAVSANTVVLHIDDGDNGATTEVQVSISMTNLSVTGDDDD